MKLSINNLQDLQRSLGGQVLPKQNEMFNELPEDGRINMGNYNYIRNWQPIFKEGDKMRIPGVLDYTGAKYPFKKLNKKKQNKDNIKYGKLGIHIKKKNRGKFTEYCGGNVTEECINRAKNSGNKKLIKRATFAENARKWKK